MGPRAGLDRCGKSRPQLRFDPQTAQPIASRYTDYGTQPTHINTTRSNNEPYPHPTIFSPITATAKYAKTEANIQCC